MRVVSQDVAARVLAKVDESSQAYRGVNEKAQRHRAEGHLVHARVGSAGEAVEDGKDVDLAREGKEKDGQRRDDVERVGPHPELQGVPWQLHHA